MPLIAQTILEITANVITVGTKYPEIISAILAIGAFDPCACSTSLIIWANAVSLPTFVALYLNMPNLFMLAPKTLSPIFLSIGMLSPVSIDSSIVVVPSTISPSTGSFSPGFTKITSPTLTSSIEIIFSTPSTIIVAFFGANPISFLIASDVFPLVLASKYFPKVIKVKIVAPDSKYKSIEKWVSPPAIFTIAYIP